MDGGAYALVCAHSRAAERIEHAPPGIRWCQLNRLARAEQDHRNIWWFPGHQADKPQYIRIRELHRTAAIAKFPGSDAINGQRYSGQYSERFIKHSWLWLRVYTARQAPLEV